MSSMRLTEVIVTVPAHPPPELELELVLVLALVEELELVPEPDELDAVVVELALDEVAPEDVEAEDDELEPEIEPPAPPEGVTVEDAPPCPSVP
jgi:hypothetical protein